MSVKTRKPGVIADRVRACVRNMCSRVGVRAGQHVRELLDGVPAVRRQAGELRARQRQRVHLVRPSPIALTLFTQF